MKKLTVLLVLVLSSINLYAENNNQNNMIQLPEPDKNVGMTLFGALQNRASSRQFSNKKVDDATLSRILWAASGINRADGKLTAPSAMNYQSVDIYVFREDGTYLWNRKGNTLQMVSGKDLREAIRNHQTGTDMFPIALLMVTDNARFDASETDAPNRWGSLDAALVCQNINLACTALGLNNVPRINMQPDVLRKELKLKPTQFPVINNIIGWK